MARKRTFERNWQGRSTYKCEACGKLTRNTGREEEGLDLCLHCAQEAYLENHHSDNHHEGEGMGDPFTCAQCKADFFNAYETLKDQWKV